MEAKQLSAAVGANKEISILAGIRVERAEIGAPGEFEAMSDSELIQALCERFERFKAELDREAQLAISDGSAALNGAETDVAEGS